MPSAPQWHLVAAGVKPVTFQTQVHQATSALCVIPVMASHAEKQADFSLHSSFADGSDQQLLSRGPNAARQTIQSGL